MRLYERGRRLYAIFFPNRNEGCIIEGAFCEVAAAAQRLHQCGATTDGYQLPPPPLIPQPIAHVVVCCWKCE